MDGSRTDVRPAQAWNEIFPPFDNGKGNTMCVDVANAAEILELG